ncbi:MAG: UrcA family protein [Pseudomonadota bacterium]
MSNKITAVAALCGVLAIAFAPSSFAGAQEDPFEFSYTVGDVLQVDKQREIADRLNREASRYCRKQSVYSHQLRASAKCRNRLVDAVNRVLKEKYPAWIIRR